MSIAPYYSDDLVQLYHGDWRDVLPQLELPPHLVVTDPPYGTGGWRRVAGTGQHHKDPKGTLVREDWDDGAVDWVGRCVAGGAQAVVSFWPSATAVELLVAARAAGLDKHRTLYWRKLDPKPLPGNRTRWSVEPVWVLSREGLVLHGGVDILETPGMRPAQAEGLGHPYQKPERLLSWVLAKLPADLLAVDPFAGTGTTLAAAKREGRPAVGVEQEERWCEVAAGRLSQGVLV